MTYCLIDFETSSGCDLKKAGAWRYAEDVSTDILCLGYSIDGGEPHVRRGEYMQYGCIAPGMTKAGQLEHMVDIPNVIFVAHNAGFEKAIWRKIMVERYGWPNIPNSRWHDSMAICAMKALPLRLEKAGLILRLPQQKDATGMAAVRRASGFDKRGQSLITPQLMETIYAYNVQDIRAEVELSNHVGGFQPGERNVWLLDQRINERGVRVDLPFIGACQAVVAGASRPLIAEFAEITGGLGVGQRDRVLAWAASQGVELPNLQKETITALLGADEEEDDDAYDTEPLGALPPLPEQVSRALTIRRSLGSASIKKLAAFQSCVGLDGRVHGALQYHAAGPGRWGGRLFQPQNFPRDQLKVFDGTEERVVDPEVLAAALGTGDYLYVQSLVGDPIAACMAGLRHALVALDGRVLNVGDLAKIECVIVLALAGATETARGVIERGSAVYTDMATKIFKHPVSKHDIADYTIGKNTVLGCGFQMGWQKFKSRYAKGHTDDFCKSAINEYRVNFAPEVPLLWAGLEEAALRSVWDHRTTEAYGCQFKHEDQWLTMRIPSGRKLYYFNPRTARKAMPWDDTDVRPAWTCQAQKTGRWITRDMYGGLITENAVQGLARDILVHGMFKCETENLPIVLTVHDEIVAEPDLAHDNHAMLGQIMCDRPEWARQLQIPVAAETWTGSRYRK